MATYAFKVPYSVKSCGIWGSQFRYLNRCTRKANSGYTISTFSTRAYTKLNGGHTNLQKFGTSRKAFQTFPICQYFGTNSFQQLTARWTKNLSHQFKQSRFYTDQTYPYSPYEPGALRKRLLYGAGIFGGTLLLINLIFNGNDTLDSTPMPIYERKYLNATFLHTGLGLGIVAVTARALHTSGWSYRLMLSNPWLVAGLGLVGSFATMYGTRATSPDNYVQKYTFWTAFNITQAALLSPLLFFHPAILARAGLYTVGLMGSLSLVGATAKQEKYLYLGGPLLAGVTVVALSGLAPLVIPATAARTLMFTEKLWLYGGLAVFGGFTLYDVQRIRHHAQLAEQGVVARDPVNESISLELDFINIFVRMVQILAMRSNSQRK